MSNQNPTTSYFIDINRFSAQDSESEQTNIWDYSLNDTIVAPSGSQISVHQAFINQKGITGQSIEFDEDIVETINYYAYISEMEHIVPILQDPIETKRKEKHEMNSQLWGYVNLLNNVTCVTRRGREGLMGNQYELSEGTYQHLDSVKFGGSGTPLILSDPPEPDHTTEIYLQVNLTPPDSLGAASQNITVTGGSSDFSFAPTADGAWDLLRFPLAYIQRKHAATPFALQGMIIATLYLRPDDGRRVGTFTAPYPGTDPTTTYEVDVHNAPSPTWSANSVYSANPEAFGVIKAGQRCYGVKGGVDIPLGALVGTVAADNNSFTVVDKHGTAVDFTAGGAKNNITVYINTNINYYCSPRPLSAQITVPKGVYGIEQLVSLVNNQLNGLSSSTSKTPTNPYDSALLNQNYDGMINQGTQGFTTKITPVSYRQGPDTVKITETDPSETFVTRHNLPDHTFVPAYTYATGWEGRRAINKKNRTNFTGAIAGFSYIGYMMDNNVTGVLDDGITPWESLPDVTDLAFLENGQQIALHGQAQISTVVNTNIASKAKGDYRIGIPAKQMLTIGSPEVNIQYDTDLSAFSINNLHASWRIPSTDILGNAITNKGEVGVGMKRCAEICDAPPYSRHQQIWGSNGRNSNTGTLNLRGKVNNGTNILSEIRFDDTQGQTPLQSVAMSFMSLGAIVIPNDAAPHPDSSTRIPNVENGKYCEVIEIIPSEQDGKPPEPTDSDGFFSVRVKFAEGTPNYASQKFISTGAEHEAGFIVGGVQATSVEEQQKIISSFQRPKSRTGGVIVYNFARATGLKYGDRPSVVDDAEYSQHASFSDFFSSKTKAKKIWKSKTLWGKLGFTYEQFNNEDYFENIVQYCAPTHYKLRGITSDTKLDISTIPTISSQVNPSDFKIQAIYGGAEVKGTQTFNNFDVNSPRTELQRNYPNDGKGSDAGRNQQSYAGSIHTMTTMNNVVAKPTPISAEELPTLSQFGYYLITSDLVPTYKDIVAKGDPLGLLGVVPKTSLSSQDFIPLANSDLVQVLNQDTIINNIRVKILNPDLSNPHLSENSSVILRIDAPIEQPVTNTVEKTKTPQKRCKKTGEKVCKCPPTSIDKIKKK